ncbi:hypothetical protein DF3PB_210007 [uncultured Defluviicoccus sp.]|uniref:Uncharacterized protein n=1 Tax=metagenome TaxID=256318 RepID=A0A380TBH1_9ZZZZ|nr:hypothetical protein DF3PB_210007 [uncultured Defluviicoccus sp.]
MIAIADISGPLAVGPKIRERGLHLGDNERGPVIDADHVSAPAVGERKFAQNPIAQFNQELGSPALRAAVDQMGRGTSRPSCYVHLVFLRFLVSSAVRAALQPLPAAEPLLQAAAPSATVSPCPMALRAAANANREVPVDDT